MVLIKPRATLLNANGSFELVGFSLIPKKPTKESILSVIDNVTLNGFFGTVESRPIGKYCSEIAKEIHSIVVPMKQIVSHHLERYNLIRWQ